MNAAQTRAFLLTPPGTGAIAIIRVAGPSSVTIVNRLFETTANPSPKRKKPDRLAYGRIRDNEGLIDDCIVAEVSAGAGSFVDIHLHGGYRIQERVLSLLHRHGAAITQPPAQTIWRADSKIDAELLGLISQARTTRSARFLIRQRQLLAGALEHIAQQCQRDGDAAMEALRALLETRRAGIALASGVTIVLTGPPNAGKSTLFNRLVGRHAAVVSSIAGTTRDWVVETIQIEGLPVMLIDTAGTRESADDLEQEAIHRGLTQAGAAHLTVLVLDAQNLTASGDGVRDTPARSSSRITVFNKSDLLARSGPGNGGPADPSHGGILVSAATGDGVARLEQTILEAFGVTDSLDTLPAIVYPALSARVEGLLSGRPVALRQARNYLLEALGKETGR